MSTDIDFLKGQSCIELTLLPEEFHYLSTLIYLRKNAVATTLLLNSTNLLIATLSESHMHRNKFEQLAL